jgi:hypothetical protein
MKRVAGIAACLAVLIVLASTSIAGAEGKLEGTWKVVEMSGMGPNASTNTNPQPGLYIFTKKHYSMQAITGDKPRPDVPQQNPTPEQLLAAFYPFMANTGAYAVKGAELTIRPVVAKYPEVMASGAFAVFTFKVEGNDQGPSCSQPVFGAAAFDVTARSRRSRDFS